MKTRILAGAMLAMVLSMGLMAFVLVQSAERNTLLADRRHEVNEAASTAARLSGQIVALQRALASAAEQTSRATVDDNLALERFAENQTVLRHMFTDVFVATADGNVRLAMDGTGISRPALNLSQRHFFQEAIAQGRSTISAALPDKRSGSPVIVFAQPVRDERGVLAVLGGTVRLDSRDLLEGLVDSQDRDWTTMVVVTDEAGQILAHPDHKRLLRPLSEEPRLGVAFASWHAIGAPAEPTGLSLSQPDEVVSAAGVAGPNWMIWRVRSEADLLGPLLDARRNTLVTAAVLVAGTMCALFAALWWLLRPLGLLEVRATHMFDGTYAPGAGWPEASDEIANLGNVLSRVGAERTRLEHENAQTMGKLTSVMNAAPMGIAFARGWRLELLNQEFCRLFGAAERDLLREDLAARFCSEADFKTVEAQMNASFRAGETYAGEWQMQRVDGVSFWAALRCSPVDAGDVSLGTVWTVNDVEDVRTARELLEWSASHDPLTGLANRKAFELEANRLIETASASKPASLAFIDLDRFKPVNDTAGHLMGDLMLLTVAKAIAGQLRSGDLAARIGGDEFALLLAGCSIESALSVAEDVRRAIVAVQLPWGSTILQVGASIGVAQLDGASLSLKAWMAAADAACYAAKAGGRNAVHAANASALNPLP